MPETFGNGTSIGKLEMSGEAVGVGVGEAIDLDRAGIGAGEVATSGDISGGEFGVSESRSEAGDSGGCCQEWGMGGGEATGRLGLGVAIGSGLGMGSATGLLASGMEIESRGAG